MQYPKQYSRLTVAFIAAGFISACGGGGGSSSSPVPTPQPTPDTQAPTISISGPNPLPHIAGTAFTAPTATVTDNVDTGLTATVTGTVTETTAAGDYTLTYTATDAAGNTATATLTVDVDRQISGTIVDARIEGGTVTVSDTNAECTTATTDADGTFTVTCDEEPAENATVSSAGGTDTLTGTEFDSSFVLTGPADNGVYVTPASTLGLDFIDTTFDPYDPEHPDYTENMVTHLLALTVIKDDIEDVNITEELIEDVLATAGPDAAQTVLASAGFPAESTQKVANIANAVGKTLAIAQATGTPLTQIDMYEDLLRAIQTDTDGTVLEAAITVIEEAELPEGVDPDFGVSTNEVVFSGVFGGAVREENLYTFPADALSFAGFANQNTALYPLNFTEAGTLTFIASVPNGGNATLNFRFENLPYLDSDPGRVEPSFVIEDVLISGSDEQIYQVDIPAQVAENTYSSLIMYIEERDTPVMIQGVVIDAVIEQTSDCNAATGAGCEPGDGGSGSGEQPPVEPQNPTFSGVFDGTVYDPQTSTHTFPAGAANHAGFANTYTADYPLSFPHGGEIVFVGAVPSGGDANVRFRFERLPWPNVDPAFETELTTVSGSDETSYSVTIPAQGENTFSSVIMYINEREVPVVIKGVVINANPPPTDSGNAGGSQSGGNDCNPATGEGCNNAEPPEPDFQWRYSGTVYAAGPVVDGDVTVVNEFAGGSNNANCSEAVTDDRGFFEIYCAEELFSFLKFEIANGTDTLTQLPAPTLRGDVGNNGFITPSSTLNLFNIDFNVDPYSLETDNFVVTAATNVASLFMLSRGIEVPAHSTEKVQTIIEDAATIADGVNTVLVRFRAIVNEIHRDDYVALILATKGLIRENPQISSNPAFIDLMRAIPDATGAGGDSGLAQLISNDERINIDFVNGELPAEQFNLNGVHYSTTRIGYYYDVSAPETTDRVVTGEENTLSVLFTDPTGYEDDTHGTRVFDTFATFDEATQGVKIIKQSLPENYYALEGTVSGFPDERPVTLSGLDAVIVEHLQDVNQSLTIVQKSWGNSPAVQAGKERWFEAREGRWYSKRMLKLAEMYAPANALFVASLENYAQPYCDVRVTLNDGKFFGGLAPAVDADLSTYRNGIYIPECGALNHTIAELEMSENLSKTIFVSTTSHTSFSDDGVFADNVVRVDMNAYDPDITNTTSHASPLVAAAAAKLAKHFGITNAVELRNQLMTYVDAQTKIINLAAIEAL